MLTQSQLTTMEQYQWFWKPSHCNDITELHKPYIPATTKNNNSCRQIQILNTTGETFPVDLLKTQYPTPITDRTIAVFTTEARSVDGNCHLGNMLKNILSAMFFLLKE